MKLQHKTFGKPVDFESYKGSINPDFDQPAFLEKLSRFELLFEDSSLQILFDGRNRISVFPFPLYEGKTISVVIKEFFTEGLNKMKTLFLPSKAKKAWWGGVALMEREIPTPVPIAYLEKINPPFIQESCYLSMLEDGVHEVRHLFRQLPQEDLLPLIRALAVHLNICHNKGILHRDLSDGNILVKKDAQDGHTFYLIDTNRIRVKKKLSGLQRIKNLTRLGIPPRYQRQFLEAYTGSERINNWGWFWYRLSKITYTWQINLKKRLRSGEFKTRNTV